eukprot:TRINITY_DN8455_c0_g1::TRINITY_DN8455_c0_g1_i1::g.3396::m.3396 TRINITY_DN8455_c0_g1::TRINITY_DN8455_c0_g1_i1::g.3396  ORF type:complete len:260 (-),score=17.40,F-box-like/PF12937.2/1.7e-10,F-box/PF00646.28/3.1e-06,F-box-like_2/PF13013.1/0.021 TRINITY_DN8455_c0_g1_i1:771-1460(-)
MSGKARPSAVKAVALKDLPDEILLRIFLSLPGTMIARACQVCKKWKMLIKTHQEELYRSAVFREFKNIVPYTHAWERGFLPRDQYIAYIRSSDSKLRNRISMAINQAMVIPPNRRMVDTVYSLVDGAVRIVRQIEGKGFTIFPVWFRVDCEELGFGGGTEDGHALVVAKETSNKMKKSRANTSNSKLIKYQFVAYLRKDYSREAMGSPNTGWAGENWRPVNWDKISQDL